MRTKTYVFEDVKKAMEVLKEEYGPDALILDVKTIGTNGSSRCEVSVLVGEKSEDITSFPKVMRERSETLWTYFLDFLNERLLEIEKALILKHIEEYPLPLKIMFERMRKNGISVDLASRILSRVFITAADVIDSMTRAFYFLKMEILKDLPVYDLRLDKRPIIVFGPKYCGKSLVSEKIYLKFQELGLKPLILIHGKTKKIDEIVGKGLPFEGRISSNCVETDEDLLRKVSDVRDRKLIIDYGSDDLPERILESLPSETEKILVLSAGLRDEKIAQYLSEKGKKMTCVAFTKLDEELSLGHLLESSIRFRSPISLLSFGTGTRDIVFPSDELFYRILLEGVRWIQGRER